MTAFDPDSEELNEFEIHHIRRYIASQRHKLQAQEAELAGELQAGTPEESLATLRHEIERRREIIEESEDMLALPVNSVPDEPVIPIPTDGPITPRPLEPAPTEVIATTATPTDPVPTEVITTTATPTEPAPTEVITTTPTTPPETTTTTAPTTSVPTVLMSSDPTTPSAGEKLDDIVEKGKSLLGVRPPAQPGEDRPPYHQTSRGKAVIGAGIAIAAGGLFLSQCGGDGQKTDTPVPVESECDLTQSSTEEIARDAIATSKGDAIEAVRVAEQVIGEFRAPNGKCSNSVVEVAKLSAAGYIAENTGSPSTRTEPDASPSPTEPQTGNVPSSSTPGTEIETPTTEQVTDEPDLTIACTDGQIDYKDQNVADSITNMPANLWEGKPCSVEAGTTQDRGIGNGEVVRIEGR